MLELYRKSWFRSWITRCGFFRLTSIRTQRRPTGLKTSEWFIVFSIWLCRLSTSCIAECPGVPNFCTVMLTWFCCSKKCNMARLIMQFLFCAMQESDHNVICVTCGWSLEIACRRLRRLLAMSFPLLPDSPSDQIAHYLCFSVTEEKWAVRL